MHVKLANMVKTGTGKYTFNFPVLPPINAKLLEFAGAVPFGSKALGVGTARSDYDFVISAANVKNLNLNDGYKVDPNNYFKYLPCFGKSIFYQRLPTTDNKYLDLLVLPTDTDVLTVSKSINYIKSTYPKEKLRQKYFRIKVYEQQLSNYGWCKPFKGLSCSLKQNLWNWLKQLLNQLTPTKSDSSDFHKLENLIKQRHLGPQRP